METNRPLIELGHYKPIVESYIRATQFLAGLIKCRYDYSSLKEYYKNAENVGNGGLVYVPGLRAAVLSKGVDGGCSIEFMDSDGDSHINFSNGKQDKNRISRKLKTDELNLDDFVSILFLHHTPQTYSRFYLDYSRLLLQFQRADD